ncbi:MAG TPA: tetratricopeptide repeat protein, partial [Chthonomonadales bacterium]|nr:tetratricopeptide repeat protein [Chthonomonadales bacterium]
YEVARDSLPETIRVRDAGLLRLRDLSRPERVYQPVYSDLQAEFPPLSREGSPPNNLPRRLTRFIDREREIDAAKDSLEAGCLLTLTGPGGCGKTRLAIEVAEESLDRYPDGVWLIDLTKTSNGGQAARMVAAELSIREEPARSPAQTLIEALRCRRTLLIMDNCEHILEHAAELAHDLLIDCPDLKIMATSRERLRVEGEIVYAVPSLRLPPAGAETSLGQASDDPNVAHALQCDAVRLYLDRAASSGGDNCVTPSHLSSVVRLCTLLDGLPLAIELAAAWAPVMSVEDICARLGDRFTLLRTEARTIAHRQRTLKALIDWSYDLLSDPEKALFRSLSVFMGGFTMDAVEQICSPVAAQNEAPGDASSAVAPLNLIRALVDKSLVQCEYTQGHARYKLLETLRKYAGDRLTESAETESMRNRHLGYYLRLAEEAERKLYGSEQGWWLDRLETENDNLRAALDWSVRSDPESALRLASAIWWFWHVRGYFSEGRGWLHAALEALPGVTAVHARALHAAGTLARNQGDYTAAEDLARQSLEIKRSLSDRQGVAASLSNLATLALTVGDYRVARSRYEEAMEIQRALGNRQGITTSLIGLANIAVELGDYPLARNLYDESLEIKQRLEDKRGIATCLMGIARIHYLEGELTQAQRQCALSLELRRAMGDPRATAYSLQLQGEISWDQGDRESAEALLNECLATRRSLGDKLGVATAQQARAEMALRASRLHECATLLTECLETYNELKNRRGLAAVCSLTCYWCAGSGRMEDAATLMQLQESIRVGIGVPLAPRDIELFREVQAKIRLANSPGFERRTPAGVEEDPDRIADLCRAALLRKDVQVAPSSTASSREPER